MKQAEGILMDALRKAALVLALVMVVAGSAAAQTIGVSIEPSRTSGVAPLAVFFDASGTTYSATGASPFHDLVYEWSFGDPDSGTWSISGKSKNSALGPVAAHVFEQPGTYTVSVNVCDASRCSQSQVTIQVQDPNTVFSGERTICVRATATGDFSGCPAGALQQTNSDWSAVAAAATAGRRILLRRGDVWPTGGGVRLNNSGPGIIGAFGTGAKPRLALSTTVLVLGAARDWRFMDLDVNRGSYVGENAFEAEGRYGENRNLLFLRVDVTEFYRAMEIAHSTIDWYHHPNNHNGMFFVDGNFTRITGGHGVYLAGERMALMGLRITEKSGSHNVRMPYATRSVLQHCYLQGSGSEQHVVKIHSGEWGSSGVTDARYGENIVVSDNIINGTNAGPWLMAIGPQSGRYDERIRNVIVERNQFRSVPEYGVALHVWASYVSVRNNIFNLSGTSRGSTGAVTTRRGIEPAPEGNRFLNNTCYRGDAGSDTTCISVTSQASNSIVRNNLLYAPSASPRSVLSNDGVGTTASDNLNATSNPFMVSSPANAADFRLAAGSAAIDAGASVASNLLDFAGNRRPYDGNSDGTARIDLGAFEFGGQYVPPTPGPEPTPEPTPTRPAAPVLLAPGT
jgi:hypothetical protein